MRKTFMVNVFVGEEDEDLNADDLFYALSSFIFGTIYVKEVP